MIVKYRKVFYFLSILLVSASIISLAFKGLNFGIDFKGGSLLEVVGDIDRAKLPPDINFAIQKSEAGTILRFSEVNEARHQEVLEAVGKEELRFEVVGPTIGQELKIKSLWAVLLVSLLILLYIAWAFRKLKGSFRYGFLAIVALVHDVLIVVGVFSLLQVEVNVAFIAAILTILGYSVNDTIVIFDRLRENLLKLRSTLTLAETIELSIKQSLRRSLFMSVTVLLVLFSVFFLGGHTVEDFVFALIVGFISGTYSSIFLAAPLLVDLERLRHQN